MDIAKKIVAMGVAVVLATSSAFVPIFAQNSSDVSASGHWIQRAVDHPYQEDGNSLIAMGAGVDVQSGAGAYYRTPLGKQEFKAEFDLEWDDTNNPTDSSGSPYEANRIAMVLAKEPVYENTSNFLSVPNNSIFVRGTHLETYQVTDGSGSSITDGTADCGTAWAFAGSGPMHVTVVMADRKMTVTFTSADETKTKVAWISYSSEFVNGDKLYFGFINAGGALKYNVKDFTITETDLTSLFFEQEKGWEAREMGGAFQTNENNDLLGQSVWGCAAAYWKAPIGSTGFKISFDMDWTNADQASDDWFTRFGLVKEPDYPNGLGDTTPYDIKNSIRIKSNKLIVSEADMDEAYYTADSASATVAEGIDLSAADTVKGTYQLKDNVVSVTITATTGGVDKTMTASFAYSDAFFNGEDLYWGVMNHGGNIAFDITNIQFEEIDGSTIDGDWLQNPVEKPYLSQGSHLLAMGEGVEVQSGAGAYYRSPLGKKEFKAEFDLEWDDTNNPTDSSGSSYDGNRIAMVLAKKPVYENAANFLSVPNNSIFVRGTHLETYQVTDGSGSSVTDGTADCGTAWAFAGSGPMHVSVVMEDCKMTVTFTSKDGTKKKVAWISYSSEFVNGDELYFGFINAGGALKYNVNNFSIVQSDLAPVTEPEIKGGWIAREMGGAFQTNENNDLLGQSAWGCAAAYWKLPIGSTGFKISFNMNWTNADQASDDWFTRFGLAKEPSYPNGLGETTIYDMKNSIRLKSNKLIVSEADMDEAYYTADSATATVAEGIDLSAADTVNGIYQLKDNVVSVTITATTNGVDKTMTASFAYSDAFFNGEDLYWGVMNHGGNIAFDITNIQFEEIDGSAIDGKWLQNPVAKPYVSQENNLFAMGEGVEVQSGAGAYYRSPLGKKEFKAEFDLEWDDANNPTDSSGSPYEANRIAMVLAKKPIYENKANFLSVPNNSIFVRGTHLETYQVTDGSGSSITDGTADCGTAWALAGNGPMHVTVVMADRKMTVTFTSKDGAKTKVAWISYSSEFVNGDELYFGFINAGGALKYNVKDFKISKTDLYSGNQENYRDENGWRVRIGEGLTSYSTDTDKALLGTVSSSGAAAFWQDAVGYNRFKATFDLEWDSSNLVEGAKNYLDSFLAITVTKDPVFKKGINAYAPVGSFRVTSNHLQAATEDMDTSVLAQMSNTEMVGGIDLKTAETAQGTLELKNRTISLTLITSDGKSATASYKYTGSFFNQKKLYVGFFSNGDIKMNVKNFTVAEDDLAGEGAIEPIDVPEGYTNDFTGTDWIVRTGEGIHQFATNAQGDLCAYGNNNINGAVWWNKQLSTDGFKVTFDIEWANDNRIENQNNYLDNFLSINLSKDPTFAEGTDPISPKGRFRVVTNHIQVVEDDMDSKYLEKNEIFTPIVGGMNLAAAPTTCTILLEDGVFFLTFEQEGVEPMQGGYTYSLDYFDGSPLYLGFSQNGDMLYKISNLKYEKTDGNKKEYQYFTGYVGGYFEKVYGEFNDDYRKYLG